MLYSSLIIDSVNVMSRIIRHFTLAGITGTGIAIFSLILDTDSTIFMLSMATAYIGTLLIALTLVLGPLNILRGKNNPTSSYLRRDIGIWAGLVSIAHVVFGLQRHFDGKIWRYFLSEPEKGQGLIMRIDAFGLTNYVGLIATILCIVLLAISNNVSLKKLGAIQWKNIQRFNYLFFILVIGHGFMFQFVVKRPLSFVLVVGLAAVMAASMQWKAFNFRKNLEA
ncbi:hypothetical protein MNBD_GAMMA05-1884 [hydrothermal vent metagenome]|uniref:Ferric oxidoreductase domain-containing protein n=1 Tax=hydrothermal vent metagenome TaxID=652676 RepID=A0A3B0XAF9_9ZZZZ